MLSIVVSTGDGITIPGTMVVNEKATKKEEKGMDSNLTLEQQEVPKKYRNIEVWVVRDNLGEEAIDVWEDFDTPRGVYSEHIGFYNMTIAYWIKHEFPLLSETAHIMVNTEYDTLGVRYLRLS